MVHIIRINCRNGATRPTMIELKNWNTKMNVLKAVKKRTDKNIYISDDYSKNVVT